MTENQKQVMREMGRTRPAVVYVAPVVHRHIYNPPAPIRASRMDMNYHARIYGGYTALGSVLNPVNVRVKR